MAGLLTIYTAVDMLRINRGRRAEFIEAQKKMEADSLEAARLAYMRGDATEEQVALVDYVNERAASDRTGTFRMPNILGPPAAMKRDSEDDGTSSGGAAAAATTNILTSAIPLSVPLGSDTSTAVQGRDSGKTEGREATAAAAAAATAAGGWRSWLFSNLKREEEGESVGSSQRRLGWESLSGEDDEGQGVRESDLVRAVESRRAYLQQKAEAALAREQENQRTGGPLDRVGLPSEKDLRSSSSSSSKEQLPSEAKKSSWWSWSR